MYIDRYRCMERDLLWRVGSRSCDLLSVSQRPRRASGVVSFNIRRPENQECRCAGAGDVPVQALSGLDDVQPPW